MYRNTSLVLFALFALLMPQFVAAQEEVTLNIRSRMTETITVFAVWETGTRTRLGDMRANQTREFTTEVNGTRVTLSVQRAGARGGEAHLSANAGGTKTMPMFVRASRSSGKFDRPAISFTGDPESRAVTLPMLLPSSPVTKPSREHPG